VPRKELRFRCLGGTFLFLILVLPAGLLAPDSWAAGQASGGDGSQRQRRSRFKRPSLDDQVKRFAETLDLNETQQSEVKKILERRQEQGSRIIRDPSPSGGDRVGKLHALNQSTVAQIRAVLTDQQKGKYNPLGQSGLPRTSPQPSVEDWLKASRPK